MEKFEHELNDEKRFYSDVFKNNTLSQLDDFISENKMSKTDALLYYMLLEIKELKNVIKTMHDDLYYISMNVDGE